MRAAFVVLLLLTGLAHADVHASKMGKVSVDIPKKWSVVNATDELVRAASPDGAIAFVMWVVESSDANDGLKKLEGELYSSIQGLRWLDNVKKVKLNKLAATWVEGAGVNARAAQLDVLVVVAGPTSTKKGVIMLAVVEHEKLVPNRKAIEKIFKSLKPTK
jgi:hypothetical protein